MKVKELRSKTEKELHKLLAQERDSLRELKFKVASKQHKDYKEIGRRKKDIARILIVLKEKLLTSQVAVENQKSKKQS
jgi:ribosomal protein L29